LDPAASRKKNESRVVTGIVRKCQVPKDTQIAFWDKNPEEDQ
jgi:hypothetical protein